MESVLMSSNGDNTVKQVVRFFRGQKLLGFTTLDEKQTLCEHAIRSEVEIPTNCTSGTCGTCLVTIISGDVDMGDELPSGIDEIIVEEGGCLACISQVKGNLDIDITPPI